MELLDEMGDFTRIGFQLYFVETQVGNFVFDQLNGTLSRYCGSYFSYLESNNILKVRFVGKRKIRDYCGDVKLIGE